jgi:hypothetical protein
LLELDPKPPRDVGALDLLKFEPLHDRVLFEASAFDPALDRALAPDDGQPGGFDLIVGNPPWTYRSEEKRSDRALDRGYGEAHAGDVSAPVSGTTYARLAGRPLPPRSPDWAFLWRAQEFCHAGTRVALLMKATPFLSQDAATSNARNLLLRAFPDVTLVNLSQLRTSRLFNEHSADEGSANGRKATAGPALLFLSNCMPVGENQVGLVNFPWSSTFQRTGVFELPADGPATIGLDLVEQRPGLLKAGLFGTSRDAWFLERLGRNPKMRSFKAWLAGAGLAAGQGYQPGTTMPAEHLVGRLVATAQDIAGGRIREELKPFAGNRAHRARLPEIYEGPLVLLPEGALTRAPVTGRYTAAYDARSLGYTESFVGVSFHGRPTTLAKAFAGLMHSALVAYQLAMSGGTVGVKQTKIEAVDLYALLIPALDEWPAAELGAMAAAYDALVAATEADDAAAVVTAARTIDAVVARELELASVDVDLLSDAGRRAGAILFETDLARRQLEIPPVPVELASYADNLCTIFNGSATEPGDMRLYVTGFVRLGSDLVVLRLDFGDAPVQAELRPSTDIVLPIDETAFASLGGSDLPYLKPARALRLYVGDSLYIVKPAHYRCFTPAAGQSDADQVVADLMMQAASEGAPA